MIVCGLLFLLCAFMIVISLMFGSEGIVGAFGYNLYLCNDSAYEGLNSGAVVVVEQCEPYDITERNLILYSAAGIDEEIIPALGYAENITMKDGVYSIEISDADGNVSVISESAFIGRAGWSSDILGGIIRFSLTPWGICVMAVLPCLALIIFSFIRSYIDSQPIPEVLPQVKNAPAEKGVSRNGLSVMEDGKARYGRQSGAKNLHSADNVLYTYSGKKNPVSKPAPDNREKPVQRTPDFLKDTAPKKTAPAAIKKESNVPSSVAAKRYIDNAVSPAPKSVNTDRPLKQETSVPKKSPAVMKADMGATAEIPQIQKKPRSDAFFAQSEAPQIGRGIKSKNSPARAVIDLEDALASTERRDIVPSAIGASRRSEQSTGKRSTDIIMEKGRAQLSADEDDRRDKGRYEVDDILAGIGKRHNS